VPLILLILPNRRLWMGWMDNDKERLDSEDEDLGKVRVEVRKKPEFDKLYVVIMGRRGMLFLPVGPDENVAATVRIDRLAVVLSLFKCIA
jgi:hypothetical protein